MIRELKEVDDDSGDTMFRFFGGKGATIPARKADMTPDDILKGLDAWHELVERHGAPLPPKKLNILSPLSSSTSSNSMITPAAGESTPTSYTSSLTPAVEESAHASSTSSLTSASGESTPVRGTATNRTSQIFTLPLGVRLF